MRLHSLVLIVAAAVLAGLGAGNPQGSNSPIPAVDPPTQTCGGCFAVADVLGVVFGDEIITKVQTVILSVGTVNGTNVTRTSFVTGQSQFTFNTAGLLGSASAAGQTNYFSGSGGTITIAGVALTSPTAYNVFTAYSVTSTVNSNGQCQTVQGTPVPISPASSYAIPPGADYALFAREAEQSFIDDLGFQTCSGGGENAASLTTHVQVVDSTVSVTMSASLTRPTPQPVSISSLASRTSSLASSTSSLASRTSSLASSTSSLASGTSSLASGTSSLASGTSSLASSTSSLASSTTRSAAPTSTPSATPQTLTLNSPTIIPVPVAVPFANGTSTSTLTSKVTVGTIVIVGSSTFIPAGSYTFIPAGPSSNASVMIFPGQAPSWRLDPGTSWLLWSAGVLSIILSVGIL